MRGRCVESSTTVTWRTLSEMQVIVQVGIRCRRKLEQVLPRIVDEATFHLIDSDGRCCVAGEDIHLPF